MIDDAFPADEHGKQTDRKLVECCRDGVRAVPDPRCIGIRRSYGRDRDDGYADLRRKDAGHVGHRLADDIPTDPDCQLP